MDVVYLLEKLAKEAFVNSIYDLDASYNSVKKFFTPEMKDQLQAKISDKKFFAHESHIVSLG